MNIKIYEDRKLLNETDNFGSQHENLATTLIFEFPEYVEKDGVQFATKDLNKTIIFDIEGDNELPIDEDNKFSFPYEITKLGEVVWNICLKEKSETEDMTDKLIWYSETMKSTFIKTNEGHNEITTEKIDVFNSMLTRLNNGIQDVEESKAYIAQLKIDVENGKFNGKDGQDGYTPVRGKDYWTPEDRTEIINEIDNKVQEDLKDYYLKSETYNKEEIDNKISLIPKFDIKVVDKLPTENIEEATVYLVKSGEESNNLYTEYIYTDGKWEQLGTQKLDLSGFYNKDEINSLLATRDSKITALQAENKTQTERIENLEKENANQAEELETLWKDYKEKEVEGETVAISDGIGKIKDTIYGMSKQNTTEGYQLFDVNDTSLVSSEYSVDNEDYITVTYDNTEGSSTKYLNYYTNPSSKIEANKKYLAVVELKKVSGNGTLTVVSTTTSSNKGQFKTPFYKTFSGLTENSKLIVPVTSVEDISDCLTMMRTYCQFNAGESGSITFRISILEDTTITADTFVYEPYTGGQASPNTEYEQDIEVITECSLVQRGINLLNEENLSVSSYYANKVASIVENLVTTTVFNDGENLTSVGITSDKFDLEDGEYYISCDMRRIRGTGDYNSVQISKTGSCDITAGNITAPTISNSFQRYVRKYTISNCVDAKAIGILFQVKNTENAVFEVKNFKISKFNLPYEPYIEPIVKEIDLAGNSIAKGDNVEISVKGNTKANKGTRYIRLTSDMAWNVANGVMYTTSIQDYKISSGKIVYSNMFKGRVNVASSASVGYNECCFYVNHNVYGFYCKSNITDVEEWKTYLDNNEVYILYDLEETEVIDLPSIEPIKLIEGITNVFELVTNLGTTMKVEYKVSNKSRLEALEQAFLLKA